MRPKMRRRLLKLPYRPKAGRLGPLVAREFLLYIQDPSAPVLLVIAPVSLLVLLGDALKLIYTDAPNTAALVSAGFAVMFSFFGISYIGWGFYRERVFATWKRVELSAGTSFGLVVAKALPMVVLLYVQAFLVMGTGFVVLGMPRGVFWFGVVTVVTALICFEMGAGVLLTALSRTPQQLNQFSQVMVLIGGALAGAIVPVARLPSWARGASRAMPQYWALTGLRESLEGRHDNWVTASVVLLGAAAVSLVVGLRSMRWDKLRPA